MQAAATQGAFLLKQYEPWFIDLQDQHRAHEPIPGAKTAGWLLGHLIVTGDFARRLCGFSPLAPREWRPLFGPGTQPSRDAGSYPPMDRLIETFRAVYSDLVANAPQASAELLALPNPFEPAREGFPTAGAFAEYLLTGHLGYHLGQLSLWRAAAGVGART
jgi:DinB family protein